MHRKFIERCIENILKERKEIYIMGDVNRELSNSNMKKAWSDYVEPVGLLIAQL